MKKIKLLSKLCALVILAFCFQNCTKADIAFKKNGDLGLNTDGSNTNNNGSSTTPPTDPGTNPNPPNSPPTDPLPPASGSLSEQYPGDVGMGSDSSVLIHDNFENGWAVSSSPKNNTTYLSVPNNQSMANGGSRYMKSTVTYDHLIQDQYIAAQNRYDFPRREDAIYFRFYAKFKGIAPKPHHWVRISAGDEGFWGSGRANLKPNGNEGFWFDFDVSNTNNSFNFYNYWYKMRSGTCENGTVDPNCSGYQGSTYYYGNTFNPPGQVPFEPDKWICIEMFAKANTVGSANGEQAFWINNKLIQHYKPGNPMGAFFRSSFHEANSCRWSNCPADSPFPGFDFRSSSNVKFKRIFLDSYYQKNTFENKKQDLIDLGLNPSNEQTIYYDDVVVATERIGCKVD